MYIFNDICIKGFLNVYFILICLLIVFYFIDIVMIILSKGIMDKINIVFVRFIVVRMIGKIKVFMILLVWFIDFIKLVVCECKWVGNDKVLIVFFWVLGFFEWLNKNNLIRKVLRSIGRWW